MNSQTQANIDRLQLRDHLRQLGYDAKMVNGDCFDIHQGGMVHYFSRDEALALAAVPSEVHPLHLIHFAERSGLNYWYDFSVFDSFPAQLSH